MPNASRSVGAAVCVIASRTSSCVRISAARASQRLASARSECFAEAVGSRMSPGTSAAQRSMSFLSVSGSSDSRSASEALTISDLSVMMAALRAFTAVSRAILIWRTISAAPSAVFGMAVAIPDSTERAAVSASIVSLLPLLRRFHRSQ